MAFRFTLRASRRLRLAATAFGGAVLAVSASGPACATDGYFAHGYGVQSKGMAGAGLADPRESLAIATNPAGAIDLGDRLDLGLDVFVPDRSASYTGTQLDRSYSGDAGSPSLIPELGFTHRLGANWAFGLAAYGNGGMATHYKDNPYARYGASGTAGVNLMQLFLSPTLAYRFAPGHSLGVGLNIAGQSFKAQGVAAFGALSADPAHFSDNGTDYTLGVGVKIGYLGHLTSRLSLGAFWQSRTYSEKFGKYAGLFENGGAFDVPSSYGAGLAYKATDRLELLFDVRRNNFSEIPSVGNPLGLLFAGHPFGAPGGAGFGWRDATAYKLGVNYRINPAWQVRAGWGYATDPVPADQTFLNILAPGVVQNQFTLGATYSRPSGLEVSGYVMEAPRHTIHGSGSIPAAFGGGEANISLAETVVGIGFGWKH